MAFFPSSLAVSTALILTLFPLLVSAHSNLGKPLPYSKQCKGDTDCKDPCPPVRGNRRPTATWKRGQDVEIVWHKNNHIGGFYRRSILRIDDMMDHEKHKETAFDFGCWSQGTFKCTNGEAMCGGDKQNKAYKNRVTIPSIYPDGDYVFAQVWYGGLQWQKKAPKYADYYSCAFIRIEGGEPIKSSVTAKFQPNPNPKTGFLKDVPADVCASGSIRPNQCGGDACENGPIMETVPEEFQNGGSHSVSSKLFSAVGDFDKTSKIEEAPAAVVQDTVEEDLEDKAADAQDAQEQTAEMNMQRELVTKKSDPTNSNMAINPLNAVEVSVGGKILASIKNGKAAAVPYNGGTIKFEAITQNRMKMKRVMIEVEGAGRKFEYVLPYTFEVSRTLTMNKFLKVDVKAMTDSGRTYEMVVYLKLAAGNNTPTTDGNNNNMTTGNRYCDRSNMPRKPSGSWGPRGSPTYQRKIKQFRQWRAFCKKCKNVC